MSRRPSSWFAATGLLALAAAATPAQPPPAARSAGAEPAHTVVLTAQVADVRSNPWRGEMTARKPNPWRGPLVGSVSAPRAGHGQVEVEFRFAPDVVVPTAAEAPAPRPACCQDRPTAAGGVRAFAPVPARPAFEADPHAGCGNVVVIAAPAAAAKLSGTWCREMPGMVIGLAFTGDELKATLVLNSDGTTATVTLTADYAVTKDGTVHGVITGADVTIGGKTDAAGLDPAGLSLELQSYTDQPFAFRCRPTDGGLMVSNVRLGGGRAVPVDALPPAMMLGGKYRPVDGPLPVPKATRGTRTAVGVCDVPPCLGSAVLATNPGAPFVVPPGFAPAPLPAYSTAPVLAAPPTVCPAPVGICPAPPAMCPTPVRTAPPPEVLETMTRVFGEMVNGPVPVPGYPTHSYPPPPPPGCFPPVPVMAVESCPPAGVVPTAYIPPSPPAPAGRPGQMPVGTWYREVGPLAYTIDVKDGHLTFTLAMTAEEDGGTVTMQYTLTGDAYLTRSDGGLVGLITGVDVTASGKELDLSDAESLLKKLPEMQRALTDKPFALSFRVYDDALVIGNVRFPAMKDGEDEMKVWASVAGRYKRSTGPRPKGRPVKVDTVGGMTLPSPRYLDHYPQFVRPDPNVPLPRELAQQAPDLPAGGTPVTPMNRPVALPEPVRAVELREVSPAPQRVRVRGQDAREIPPARE